jgi:hypothetical protein
VDRALEGHHRYLVVSRETCARHPLVHSHQLAALEREIALTESATGIAGYRVASGDSFELTRAGWLDRLANHARVAVLVGDRWSAEAAALQYARALEATGHADWPGTLGAGGAAAARLTTGGGEAAAFFTRLLLNLLRVREEQRPALLEQFRAAALDAYRSLRATDPSFAWSRVPGRPHYALRTPWAGPGLEAIGAWMEAFLDDAVPRPAGTSDAAEGDDDALAALAASEARWRSQLPQRPPGPLLPDVAHHDLAAPYRALAEATTGDGRAAEATRRAARALVAAAAAAPSPQHALARFVADGLLTELAAGPVRAQAEESLERQQVWPDPLVERHHRRMLDALGDVRTTTEVDLVATHAGACFSVEADWNLLYLSSLFGPLRAACTLGADDGVAARTNLHRAADVTYRLLGLTPWSLLTAPRVADFIARILAPLAVRESLSIGAFRGEGGFDFLGEARVWVAVARAGGGWKELDARIAAERMAALCERAGLAERTPSPRAVTLWRVAVASEDPWGDPRSPRRPPIPGIDPPEGSGRGL